MEKLPSGLLVMQKALNKKLRSPHQVALSRSRDPETRSGSELWRGRLISYVVKRERERERLGTRRSERHVGFKRRGEDHSVWFIIQYFKRRRLRDGFIISEEPVCPTRCKI